MKGVPLRVEIGPKDMEKGECVIARRDTGEKYFVPLEELEAKVTEFLKAVHTNLYRLRRQAAGGEHLHLRDPGGGQGGHGRAGRLCRDHVVRQPGVRAGHEGEGRRLLPVHAPAFQKKIGACKCAVCGKSADKMVVWGVAY